MLIIISYNFSITLSYYRYSPNGDISIQGICVLLPCQTTKVPCMALAHM